MGREKNNPKTGTVKDPQIANQSRERRNKIYFLKDNHCLKFSKNFYYS